MTLFRKLLSVLIIFSMIIGMIPVSQVNEKSIIHAEEVVSTPDAEKATVAGEIESLRDKYNKHFRMSDGSIVAANYTDAVHYQNNGKWENIDNSLTDKIDSSIGSVLENKNNSYKIQFAKQSDNKQLVNISVAGQKISWGVQSSQAVTIDENKAASVPTEIDTSTPTEMISKNAKSSISYKEILPGIDLEYIAKGEEIKENIVLKTKESLNAISFIYNFNGLEPQLNKDNSITLFNPKDLNETPIMFTSPFMYDKNYEYSNALDIKIEKIGKEHKITVTADLEWLDAKERVFPVIIDPTVVTDKSLMQIADAYAYSGNPNSSAYCGYEHIRVGKDTTNNIFRSLIKFNLPSLKSSDRIVNSTLQLSTYGHDPLLINSFDKDPYINVHKMETSWSESSFTWNTLWSSNRSNGFSSIVSEFNQITSAGMYQWDITKMTSEWYVTGVNNGLLLKYLDETSTSTYNEIFFTSSDYIYITQDEYPIAYITYRNTSGLEGCYSYHDQGTGRAGTGYVNDYTGNLVFTHSDATTPGSKFPAAVSHVYGNDKKVTSTQYNSVYPKYGNGWTIDGVQTLNSSNLTGFPYKYTDGDGTDHYFFDDPSDSTTGPYIDEDGLGLKLQVYTSIQESLYWYSITDKSGTVLKFDKTFSTGGLLRKVTNNSSSSMFYNYSAGNNGTSTYYYLTKIIDGAGSEINLTYTNHYLTGITDPGGRTTTYAYSSGYLASITYSDNKTTTYNYDGPSGFLSKATNFDGYHVIYTYNTVNPPYRVSKIEEKNGTTAGGALNVTYAYNSTTFTDSFDSTKANTYQFNTYGNTISVYDKQGNAGNYQYNNAIQSKLNNSLAQSANVSKAVVNLFANHSFESGLTGWTAGGMGTVAVNTTNPLIGNQSISTTNANTSNDAFSVICRDDMSTLGTGTYTISAHLKTVGIVNNDPGYTGVFGAGFCLKIVNTGVTRWVLSDLLKGTTDSTIDNGWQRVSATFTLATGDAIERINLGVYNSIGTAYIDGVQLEKGSAMNQYNLVENSSFEKNTGLGTTPTGWTTEYMTTGSNGIANTNVNEGSYSYKISGDPTKNKDIYQNIKVKGNEGDVFSLSGWATADSIPSGSSFLFSIAIRIDYSDGVIQYDKYLFNTSVNTLQNLSKTFIVSDGNAATNKAYTQMFIFFTYHANANTAYFDNIQLYKDATQSYQYDSNGNVISTADLAKQDSSFSYTNDNLSKMANPNGTAYEYIYDTSKRVSSAKSSEGVKYNFTYDTSGNPLTTEILNDSSSTSITPGKTYYIRAMNGGKYLQPLNQSGTAGTDVVQYTLNRGTAQRWKVENVGAGYIRLIPQNATSSSLEVTGGSIANGTQMQINATVTTLDAQKFKILPNSDGTYRILTKTTNDVMGLHVGTPYTSDNSLVTQNTYNGYSNEKWYFESTENVTTTATWDTPTDGGVYYIRAGHSGQNIDISGGSGSVGAQAVQKFYTGGKSQQYKLVATTSSYYKLVPLHCTGMVLGLDGANSVKLYADGSTDNLQFKFESTGSPNYRYKIISKANNSYALDISGASYSQDTNLIATSTGTGSNKEFIFEKVSDKILSSATYSSNGNYLESVTDASGNTTNHTISTDNKGTLDHVAAPGEDTSTYTSYTYEPNTDALLSVSKTDGTQTITNDYGYLNDKLDKITHNGFDYKFGYDLFGNTTTVAVGTTGNMTTLVTNTFKPNNGLLDYITYGNSNGTNNKISYVYNTDDMVESVKYDGVEKFKYIYDNTGNLYQKTDNINSQTTNYFYDFIKRPIRTKNSNGFSLLYNYDSKNRLSSYTNQLSGINTKTGYVYGDANIANQTPGLIYGVKINDVQKLTYTYDNLARLQQKTIPMPTGTINTSYSYFAGASENTTTTKLGSITNSVNGTSLSTSYTYDIKGNIATISEDGVQKVEYFYDNLNQLKRENNLYINKTITYSYDFGGNITSKNEYAYTTQTDLSGETPTATIPYAYTDSNWKDKLTSFNGESLTYDAIGNPLTIGSNWSFSWQNGRRLESTTKNGVTSTFKYDDNGIRTQKIVGGVTSTYYLNGDRVEIETNGSDTMQYFYDEKEDLFGFNIKNSTYPTGENFYYIRNGQNDITGIVLDSTGIQVVSYVYDSWGKLISTTGTLATTIGVKNPYLYRGYRYDTETGLYYLQSRYYNPEIGRFLNADDTDVLEVDQDSLLENNLFAYCHNNVIMLKDDTGYIPVETIVDIASIGFSAYDLITKPSWINVGFLLWDVAATCIPYVPGSYVAKGIKAGTKIISKADDVAKISVKSARRAAVKKAWKQEAKMVKSTGKGTTKWTKAQKKELLQNGKVKGFQGHHINSVKSSPNLAGDPNNIRFLSSQDHLKAHGGNWRNSTKGDLLSRFW